MLDYFIKNQLKATKRTIRFFEEILRSTNNGIIVTDVMKNIIVANDAFCAFFDCKWRDVIETNLFVWLEQLDDNAPEQWTALEENVYRSGFWQEAEFQRTTTDGVKYFSVNASLVENLDTKEHGIIVSIWRNITRQRQMENEIIASERLAVLGKISGSIAHEIKNPLGVIDSSAYYLDLKLKDADYKIKEHLNRIKAQVRKASGIIQNLLDVAKMKEPYKEAININTIITNILLTMNLPPTMKIIKKMTDTVIKADREQLEMVFNNIIVNAFQAMDGRGILSIYAQEKDISGNKCIEIQFHDTGPGITPENQERIFTPLYSTKTTGIGFGLTICKMIIERHGGTITVASEKGKGATFIIQLPIV
ncbi:MAG: PAS domain S-box protein [Candidatus Kuenenia sp.]|nr:PAS domain S-box protein [Candidatus Kuenenia hertensis]